MIVLKNTIKYFLYAMSISCILYYTIKYYFNNCLVFNSSKIVPWTIIVFIILSCLILGVSNSIKLDKVIRQNLQLGETIIKMSEQIENFHYSEMSNINSVMECVVDIDSGNI